jgi:DHA1 family bicyclomycin/chloramphenicol resistance-like MFS transporter
MNKKQQLNLIIILGALAALGPFSIDTYLPGFPAIAEDLDTTISKVSLTLTSYFIGISVGQLIYGPMLDRFGRKKPLILGLGLYFLTSVTCIFVPNIDLLIGLRLLQALGGCVGMVATRAIVRDRFEVKEIARAFSSLILVMGVAPIIAPTIGGYIANALGWRYIFVLLSLFSAALIIILHNFLSESKEPDRDVSLKISSIIKNYWKVLKNREFVLYGFAGSMAMAGLFVYIAGSPFVFMELLGFSEKSYGWLFGLNAFGFIAGSQLNRHVLKKRDSEKVTMITAILMFTISMFALGGAALNLLNTFLICATLFGFMFFLGFVNPNTTAMALAPFER